MVKRVTPKTLPAVWERLTTYVTAVSVDIDATKAFCGELNDFLDKILNQDGFGTEGQLDPRGDHRNNE